MMLQCYGACLLEDMTCDVAVPWCLSTGAYDMCCCSDMVLVYWWI